MEEFFYSLMSLPQEEVEIMNITEKDNGKVVLSIKGCWKKQQCPNCGSYNTKRIGTKLEVVKNVKHLFLSSYTTVELDIHKRRYICYDCTKKENGKRKYFMEVFSFLDKSCHYTNIFKGYILKEWRYQSIEEMARKFKVSNTLIYALLWTVSIESLIENNITFLKWLSSIALWIDEVSFKGKDYFLHITELVTGKTIAVLRNNSSTELKKWLDLLPREILAKIKYIASDMNGSYKHTIQKFIREKLSWEIILWKVDAKIGAWVADLFHVKQLFNNLILEVYNLNGWMIKGGYYDNKHKDLTKKEVVDGNKYRTIPLPGDMRTYSPNSKGYKPITLWYFLSSRYHSLLWTTHDKLTENQKHRVNQILIEYDPKGFMGEAYLWKELMNEAVETKDIALVQKIISDFVSSKHYKIQTLWGTLKKWINEIKNYFESGFTNALTEGKNTQIKLFKRMAFWYKIKDNYMKRILLSL